MGLDVYVGPLCRYYSGAWQTIVQQWADSEGIPIKIVRPREGGLRAAWRKLLSSLNLKRLSADPVDIVRAWRDGLAAQDRFLPGADWNWPESLEMEFETDKPGFDGYGAVQLWAAYALRPDLIRPQELPSDWSQDPAFAPVSQSPSSFGHILLPELWLPVRFDEIFEAQEPNGNQPKIGSVFVLWEQLRRLNDVSWNVSADTIRKWRKDDFDPGNLESMARWGFSIFFCLTESAVNNKFPMRLDY